MRREVMLFHQPLKALTFDAGESRRFRNVATCFGEALDEEFFLEGFDERLLCGIEITINNGDIYSLQTARVKEFLFRLLQILFGNTGPAIFNLDFYYFFSFGQNHFRGGYVNARVLHSAVLANFLVRKDLITLLTDHGFRNC